jgi:uncharacterized protein (DUF983 family)
VIDRVATWLGGLTQQALAWFDHLDGWLQFVIVIVAALVTVALMHVDDLARAREWHEFKCWQEQQRRSLKGMKR